MKVIKTCTNYDCKDYNREIEVDEIKDGHKGFLYCESCLVGKIVFQMEWEDPDREEEEMIPADFDIRKILNG